MSLKPRLLICDIDGVVCDSRDRQARYINLLGDTNDFILSLNEYNSTTDGDEVIDRGVSLLNFTCSAFAIRRVVFSTDRGELGRENTLSWLRENVRPNISSEDLLMRPLDVELSPGIFWKEGVERLSTVDLKRGKALNLMKDYNVFLALDDRADLICMYQELGINALQVCWSDIDCLTLVGDKRS